MLRAYFGHHKAASTWVRGMIRDVAVGLRLDIFTAHVPAQWERYGSLGGYIAAKQPGILSMSNATQEWVDTLPDLRGFHVIRDPRDIVVSGYFHHMNAHKDVVDGITWAELPPHRERLRSLDKDEGLLAQIEFSYPYVHTMATWNYDQPGVLEVKMEDLVAEPLKRWTEIYTHWDILAPDGARADRVRHAVARWNLAIRRRSPRAAAKLRGTLRLPQLPLGRLPASYVPDALEAHSFQRMTGGRLPGQEDPNHKFRRGLPGDWRNHLTPRHLAAFRDMHGDLVERLGYEW